MTKKAGLCHASFPGRPEKSGAKKDINCHMARLNREHAGFLSLDQWGKGEQVERWLRPEVSLLTSMA
jgi:hypothetical protein